MLSLTIDEIVEMLRSWHDDSLRDFHKDADREEAVEGWIEHMRFGGYDVGHNYTPPPILVDPSEVT